MGLTAAQRRTLSRKAADSTLEVEHILKVAELGDATDAPFLRSLTSQHGWSVTGRDGNRLVAPIGRWADTVCCFLENGYPGLVKESKETTDAVDFCVGVLETLKTAASVSAILAVGGPVIVRPAADVKVAARLASGLNLLLSFKDAPAITPAVERKVRVFLHRLVASNLSEVQRAIAVCALRGVGDEESAALVASLPPFQGNWVGLEKSAVRQIKQRIRRAEGDLG
jgi:hypothetical protein